MKSNLVAGYLGYYRAMFITVGIILYYFGFCKAKV